jgi:hypothetical protein
MAVAVFLGGFGFGNLGDEACLATAYDLYKLETNCTFANSERIAAKAADFDFYFSEVPKLFERFPVIDRVVIAGGGVGFMPSFRDNLDWCLRCKNRGAEVIVHNIGVSKIGPQWSADFPYLIPVLTEAKEFTVRDFRSKSEVESWGLGLSPEVSFYPERNLPPNPKLSKKLPRGVDFLGISINNRKELWSVLKQNIGPLKSVLSAFDDCAILPIVSTIHTVDEEEYDNVGFQRFAELFDLTDRVVFKEVCDPSYWIENIGPGDVKYLVGRCRHLLSARKHNIIHAIGSGVPFLGIFEFDNDSIARVYQTLYPELAKNSSLFPLFPS